MIVQPNYDRVTDALANDVDATGFFSRLQGDVAVENAPPCLAGQARSRKAPSVLDAAMLGADGRIDMKAYTKRFVEDGFYTKALRCKDCAVKEGCPGVHVNWVRAHSFTEGRRGFVGCSGGSSRSVSLSWRLSSSGFWAEKNPLLPYHADCQ